MVDLWRVETEDKSGYMWGGGGIGSLGVGEEAAKKTEWEKKTEWGVEGAREESPSPDSATQRRCRSACRWRRIPCLSSPWARLREALQMGPEAEGFARRPCSGDARCVPIRRLCSFLHHTRNTGLLCRGVHLPPRTLPATVRLCSEVSRLT